MADLKRVLLEQGRKNKDTYSLNPVEVKPLYLFIRGGAGAGKIQFIKAKYHSVVKTFRHATTKPD